MRDIKIIGVASGWGAQDQGCAKGPEVLREHGLQAQLLADGISVAWDETLFPVPEKNKIHLISSLCERLAGKVSGMIVNGSLPVILGGDHSCAIGTWSGVVLATRNSGPLGLIWIDAHMDSHTPETSPSGALHGMPLACLLGYGITSLVELGGFYPKLLPQHVCLVGVRSFEAGESELLKKLGVRIFFMDEVRRRGVGVVMQDALNIAQQGTAGFGVSIDLDALDPFEDPGVGSPSPDGIMGVELLDALKQIKECVNLLGIEVVEYNPDRDQNTVTANRAIQLLAAMLPRNNL
ncbi:arginase [Sulfurirhabdus autotrophica]|uniref:Arginase n=1 Tax=Sulfurirhabdus autotrophica TaxID=1706046 RepID=A0A4R3YAK3_9PROT|nr:arginase [Sulfurirhabdus autotrophica]TCV88976.1 arginase [Sulfurirhabdus autotrophica]